MNLEEARAWLEGLIDVERAPRRRELRLSLEPVTRLLERVGRPERGLSVLHVAGSKGKGSTALFAEAVLAAAGERVGTFTSPHLERWTERFRIGGREVAAPDLADVLTRLRPHVEALLHDPDAPDPSFFDATTAAAFLLFREAVVERAVVEVGLGGRLDSTNVVEPAVACITSIELEHTDRLGATLEAIAGEKAGIVKPGRPVVTVPGTPPVVLPAENITTNSFEAWWEASEGATSYRLDVSLNPFFTGGAASFSTAASTAFRHPFRLIARAASFSASATRASGGNTRSFTARRPSNGKCPSATSC